MIRFFSHFHFFYLNIFLKLLLSYCLFMNNASMSKMKKTDWVKTQLYNSLANYVSWKKISETDNRKKGKIIGKKIDFWKKFKGVMHPSRPPTWIHHCRIILQKSVFKVINKEKPPRMLSLACNLLKMDAYSMI